MGLVRLLATLALVVAVAVSCGGDDPPADEPDVAPAATELEITVWPRGRNGEKRTTTLTCDPAGGTHPAPGAACAALARNRDALAPVPRDVACTQVYGGPARAELRGTVDRERVTATLSRHNGCEIARWDALEPVLGFAGS